ncbi:MAG: extracellular solute-binding protein family 3 [Frankiales bacterium]|jgi:glutamate transport system substrate-binding protein|nr:extracellular solute-binding protein family 3 [Frankiales bacterium]
MRLRTAAALAALALTLTACGGGDEQGDLGSGTPDTKPTFEAGTTMARIQSAGVLKVGTKFDQPLYGEKQLSGDVEGFDVNVAKILADELGVQPEFTEAVSKNREPFIQNGTVDIVVATYTINDKRKQVIDFAGPYYVTGQSIMVKKDDSAITDKAGLAGKRVCSVEGSTPAERIKTEVPTAKLTTFDTYGKCAEALKNGQTDAVTTDEAILLGLVSKSPEDFQVVGEPFSEEPYGIGLKKGDQPFRDFLNDTLEKAYEDGRWEKALKDTVGTVQDQLPSPPPVDRYTAAG